MSLYHETAEILSASPDHGGSLKSRVFRKKGLKSSPTQVYALAFETCKWSGVLKEVIEAADLLRHERKLTPILALLLVHDFLLAKSGIALPQSHGLRQTIERHKARLTSELTRARLRRKMPSIEALKADVSANADPEGRHPRWIRVNWLKSDIETQLETTFKGFERVYSVEAVTQSTEKALFIDCHIPHLLAVSPGTDVTKSPAYLNGEIILQDKASCFPAYLLDPQAEDGDVIDSCAAPGNKTTHLAAILKLHEPEQGVQEQTIFAFERDSKRAQTLEKMVKIAGSRPTTKIGLGMDFLEVDPKASTYKNVGALLLDPSCSGSGIVGRDSMPELHLPEIQGPGGAKGAKAKPAAKADNRKRKRDDKEYAKQMMFDDDGNAVEIQSEQELQRRLDSLAAFQLTLLLHAMKFPAAKKITYSTCSIHAEENEGVVVRALQSKIAKERGWRILEREKQVHGMREWPVRGLPEAAEGDETVADACIRAYKGDRHGVMGFFVAAFARDGDKDEAADDDGPYVRDDEGRIVRDVTGMPVLKSTGQPVELEGSIIIDPSRQQEEDFEEEDESSGEDVSGSSEDYDSDEEGDGDEWNGFD